MVDFYHLCIIRSLDLGAASHRIRCRIWAIESGLLRSTEQVNVLDEYVCQGNIIIIILDNEFLMMSFYD